MKTLIYTLLFVQILFSQTGITVPFTLQNQFNGNYDYTIIGSTNNPIDNFNNTTSTCTMLTQTSATLNLQPNQNIVGAYLYWSGIGQGNYANVPTLNGISMFPDSTLNLDIYTPTPSIPYFTNIKDITALVQVTGNGNYTFANFDLNPYLGPYCFQNIYYSGWYIVIVYQDSTVPITQLNIYKGFEFTGNGTYITTNFFIENINIVDNQNAKMTYVSFDGSAQSFFNESIQINGNSLSNALNPINNPFNSTNSFTGSTTSWDQDIDTFDISPYINVGDIEAEIRINTGDLILLSSIITSIRSELPDATVAINTVSGQTVCNNRDLVVNYTVSNVNSNAPLPANVPVSIYADNVLLQTVNTPASIAIGGNLSQQTMVTIPAGVPSNFVLKVIVDNNASNASTVAESNENNNSSTINITLSGTIITPTFTIANTFYKNAVVPVLPTTSNNTISGSWSPSVIDNQASGNYVFTPTAGQCADNFTLSVTINNPTSPTFTIANTFCKNALVPTLPTTSNNGISGSWSPNVINNQASGSYVFTPTAGQCADNFTLNVTITNPTTPTFTIANIFCKNAIVPTLPTTSNNGISGTWSPSVIDNQASGSYVFTPTAGQCASTFTLNFTITNPTTPTFTIANTFCKNAVVPTLPSTSNNGISGTWSPNIIDNQASSDYIFTPTAGQCADNFTLNVTIVGPRISNADVSICINDLGVAAATILNTNLSTANFVINWTKDTVNFANNQSTLTVSDKGIYQATATNIATGCVSIFNFNVIEINPLTYEIIVGEDFSQNQNIFVITSGGSGQYEYSFDNQPFQSESTFYAQDGGDILVQIRDLNNCYEVSKVVTIWQFPRFFTPNNDGFNDFWKIKTNKTIIVDIFDRYGKLIKQLKTNDNWDGTFNNAALPATDYWFVVYYNESKTFKSHFALKR